MSGRGKKKSSKATGKRKNRDAVDQEAFEKELQAMCNKTRAFMDQFAGEKKSGKPSTVDAGPEQTSGSILNLAQPLIVFPTLPNTMSFVRADQKRINSILKTGQLPAIPWNEVKKRFRLTRDLEGTLYLSSMLRGV